jgi:hypothetical protein
VRHLYWNWLNVFAIYAAVARNQLFEQYCVRPYLICMLILL